MGLREEIIAINYHAFEHAALAKGKTEGDVADEIINKVLDAAVEAIKNKEINPELDDNGKPVAVTRHYCNGWYHCLGSDIQEINKLRGK